MVSGKVALFALTLVVLGLIGCGSGLRKDVVQKGQDDNLEFFGPNLIQRVTKSLKTLP